MKLFWQVIFLASLFSLFSGCVSNGEDDIGSVGESSAPINKHEEVQYKQALIRCHKTGGSRIIKINGELRCY